MGDLYRTNFQRNCLDTPHQTEFLKGPGLVPWDPVNWPIMAAMCGVCYLVSVELLVKVIYLLRNIRGLYFWSLIIGPAGCMIHITGSLVKFFVDGVPWQISTMIILLGWWPMIVGQSLVLYSRLYLVVDSKLVIWSIRAMIGTTFVAFLIPAPVSLFLTNALPTNPGYERYFSTIEKTQLCCFLASEMVISITYIFATCRVLRSSAVIKVKRVVRLLIVTNVTIIALDALVFTMQMLGWYAIQATLKPAVYAVKFKLEFAFLNQLLFITKLGFNFVHDLNKQPKDEVQLQESSHTNPGREPGKISISKEGSRNTENPFGSEPDHESPPATIASSPRADPSQQYQNFEAYHLWEDEETVADSPYAALRDPERRPSVVTHIDAAANRQRSTLSGLRRRDSNEHLGSDMHGRLRRAENGLHDFVPDDNVA